METIITRTMFCKHCHGADRPRKGNLFIVYGHDHKALILRKCHADGYAGFTPHIIVYEFPVVITTKGIRIVASCGIHQCGISIGEAKKNDTHEITFLNVQESFLAPTDFRSLLTQWTRSGYEII